jgi:hypothetical protein
MRTSTPFFDSKGPKEPLLQLMDLLKIDHDGSITGINIELSNARMHGNAFRSEILARMNTQETEMRRVFDELGLTAVRDSPMINGIYSYLLATAHRPVLEHLRRQCRLHKIVITVKAIFFSGNNQSVAENDWYETLLTRFTNAEPPEIFTTIHASGMSFADLLTTYVLKQELMPPADPNTVLIVSEQPYVLADILTARRLLGHDYIIDGVGAAPAEDTPPATFLDAACRVVEELTVLEAVSAA